MVERLDLPRVEGQLILWVRHGSIDRIADDLQRPAQGDPQGMVEDNPTATPIQYGVILRVGHFEPTTDGAYRAPTEPEAHRRDPFQGAFRGLPIGQSGHFHDVLAEEK